MTSPDLLLTVAGLVSVCVVTIANLRRTKNVHHDVRDVRRQVVNGTDSEATTLRTIVDDVHEGTRHIIAFHEYQRTRNHDVIEMQLSLHVRLWLLTRSLDPELARQLGPPDVKKWARELADHGG